MTMKVTIMGLLCFLIMGCVADRPGERILEPHGAIEIQQAPPYDREAERRARITTRYVVFKNYDGEVKIKRLGYPIDIDIADLLLDYRRTLPVSDLVPEMRRLLSKGESIKCYIVSRLGNAVPEQSLLARLLKSSPRAGYWKVGQRQKKLRSGTFPTLDTKFSVAMRPIYGKNLWRELCIGCHEGSKKSAPRLGLVAKTELSFDIHQQTESGPTLRANYLAAEASLTTPKRGAGPLMPVTKREVAALNAYFLQLRIERPTGSSGF